MTNDLTVQPASERTEQQLSADEEAVLTIAAQGESMIPLGRWEEPVLRLAQLGYMHKNDQFNYVITPAGAARAQGIEEESDQAMLAVLNSPAALVSRMCAVVDRALAAKDLAAKDEALTMMRDGLGVLRQKLSPTVFSLNGDKLA